MNEAVACSLAVVAAEASGAAAELVREDVNGMIVPPGDVAALARAVEHVTHPDVCRRMQGEAQGALSHWRKTADPVAGVREALKHFKVVDSHE